MTFINAEMRLLKYPATLKQTKDLQGQSSESTGYRIMLTVRTPEYDKQMKEKHTEVAYEESLSGIYQA